MKINLHLYRLRLLPALIIAAVLTMVLFTATAKSRKNTRVDWDELARQRKGDYVFAGAYQAIVQDSIGASLELLDYARRLKPDDKAIAGNAEVLRVAILKLDTAELAKSYQTMLGAWRSDPDDYHAGANVAALAGKIGNFDDAVEVWHVLDSIYSKQTEPSVKLAEAYTHRYIYEQDTADYEMALRIFDRLEKESGKDVGLSSQKIRTLMLRNDTAAVDAEIASLLKALPDESTPLLFAGLLNDQLGRDSLVLDYYNRAAEVDSTDGRVFNQLAEFYRERGDSVAYRNEVFRSLESSNLDFVIKDRILRGYLSELYADSIEWPRIEQMFGILRRLHPDEAEVYTLNGVFEYSRENYNIAREQFGYAVSLEPSNAEFRNLLVQADYSADSLDAAISDALPGLELNPDDLSFPFMIVSSMYAQKRYDDAIAFFKKLDIREAEDKVKAGNIITMIGDAYQMSGKIDSAMATYERALAINPENYMAYNNAAYFMATQGIDLPKAERYAGYAIAVEPENSTYLDTYAWVKFKQQDYKEAKTYIDKAINTILDISEFKVLPYEEYDSVAYDEAGGALHYKSESETDSIAVGDEAADMVTEVRIVRDLPNYDKYDEEIGPEILEHAGDIYYMCGEPDAALLFWKRALALKPDDSDLLRRKVKAKAFLYK